VPFALLFRPRPGAAALALEDSAGFPVPPGAGAALEHLERLARQVTSSGVAVTLERDEQVRALGHEGPWGEPTLGVCVVPVRRFAGEAARGALVVGLSSRLAFEATYADFLEALARQLAVSIDEAAAAQTERTLLERERDARREAEASRNRLFALFENAPAFVALLEGPRHVFQLVNPLYQRMIGENRTLVGLPVAEAVPEVVDQGFVELLDSVLQAGTPFIGREVPLRLDTRGDGTLRQVYLNFVYQPRCDALGRVEGIDVFGFEVTEEVLARQAVEALAEQLRSSEQNFRVLLESIPQQVWTASVDGALDYVNDQVAGYFEGPREALLGAGWLAFVHPEDQPLTRERWAQSLTTGQPYEHEFRLRRADGEYRWYLARAQAVRGPGGAILRWFGTNTDVDDTKRIREALKRRTEFEQYLVGIVSHDLRSPLNAILLASGALARNPGLDAAAAKAVGRIESATRRAARMIRDLLDFTETRLGGSIPVVRKPIDLREVLRASLEELEAAHPGRRIRVSHQGVPTGEWDGDRMAQVVQNLGANALKYSPGDSEVSIETNALADKVLLRVHNRGTPIASEKLSRIFEPLQRATGEVDPSGRSVGLGLYIVKQILEAHGGSIEVSSTGEGTTFTAQLPRFDAGRAP
jgi:PAS domain S-box-containing protein